MNFGFRTRMLFNIMGGEGSVGGGETPPAVVDPSTPPPSTFTPPEWAKGLEGIDHEILKEPMFATIKGIPDIIKGYHSAQKMVGADKVVVPNKHSTPEQIKEYYIKAGLPAKLEDYKVELPPSMDNQEFNSALTAKAYELNIRPDQLAEVVKLMESNVDNIVKAYEQEEQASIAATADELKKEWGSDFGKNIMAGQRVIKHFGGDETLKAVLESPLANDGQFIRLMAKIGAKLTSEDSFQQDVVARFGMGAEEASRKINDIYSDRKHPYFDPTSPKHKDAVEEMARLQLIKAEPIKK